MRPLVKPARTRIIGRAACALAVIGVAAATRAAEEPLFSFEASVRPILKAHCFQCHGEQGKREGGLDLRLRRLLVTGGDSGPAIVAGKPAESHLLKRVRDGEMPPGDDAKKLSREQVAILENWIAAGATTARPEPESLPTGFFISEEDRQHWSFQPIRRPGVPRPEQQAPARTAIDAFLLAQLTEHGQSFTPQADKRTLLRRAYFDLIGLPPSPEVVEAFLRDEAPDAYERLIERLLDSPHYGERWGRHWLDIAGYADSDGAAGDDIRRHAYRYRDYVIRSFNADKPFDQFIREQLAGDEMVGPVSGTPTAEQAEKLVATGFLQMAPDATTSAEDRTAAHDQLVADTIKIVSSSLLGLSVGCARCHDHRFDPISQDDYYRFRAIFEPALDLRNWQGKSRLISYSTDEDREHIRDLLRKQEQAVVLRVVERQINMLAGERRAAVRAAYETPQDKRTPEQKQLVTDAGLDISVENVQKFDRTVTMELNRLRQKFAPLQQGFIQAIRETGSNVPRTFLFFRGNPKELRHELPPGELTILEDASDGEIPLNDPALPSTGRRLAYARHLTNGTHPLVARVIVNRVWMHHFGRGLCATPTDFGTQGDRPSHPELLDWLAREFMDSGWSLKQLHKLIMTSMAYRQDVLRNEALKQVDPENRLLGGFVLRRLEAEIVRDAILAVSGNLNRKPFGTPVPVMMDPTGEAVIGLENTNAGIPLAVIPMFGEEFRRSVYVQARRTLPLTFMQMFDTPAMEPNCEARITSTVAPQSLVLMNSPFILEQSLRFAQRVLAEAGEDRQEQIQRAWMLAYSRAPSAEELADTIGFLQKRADYFRAHPPAPVQREIVPGRNMMAMRPQGLDLLVEEASQTDPELLALALLCQMLVSSNEFLYVG
jgi:mono/diheme cytochrome c family protein